MLMNLVAIERVTRSEKIYGSYIEEWFYRTFKNARPEEKIDRSGEWGDMFGHYDFVVENRPANYTIDVKAMKSIRRGDPLCPIIIVSEWKNVRGKKGSIRGSATHMCFEGPHSFCIMRREVLEQITSEVRGIENPRLIPSYRDFNHYNFDTNNLKCPYHRRNKEDSFIYLDFTKLYREYIAICGVRPLMINKIQYHLLAFINEFHKELKKLPYMKPEEIEEVDELYTASQSFVLFN
jgi:hypothetical protein